MIRNSATVICLVLAFASMIGAQTSAPSVNSGGALNAASYSGVVAPGSIAAVFGSFLLNSPSTAEFVPLPTNISGLSFEFGSGVLSPLFYVSGGQVNLQVPWELTGEAQVPVTASLGGNAGNAQTVALAPFAPGIFAMNGQGTGQGAILNSTYHLANGSSPATAGSDIVQIFCTGLGPVTNQPPTGSPASSSLLSMTTTNPTVTIGGAPATVQFSGLAPGLVGVYQVNALVPAASIAGAAVPVTITIGSAISNTVTMAVNAPVGPGTLQINITGLLSGTSASVSVTSLNGFSAVVTTNQALTVPSGVYTVFANTVPAGSMTYGAFPTQQLATVTPGSTTTIQVPYTAIIPQTTQTLDQQGAQGLSVSTDASTLTISAASPVAQSLAPGSVLAIGVTPATPNGLLRKVVSVAQNGSLIVATTTQATLADAFAQADFSFGTQFTIQNAYVRTLRPGVRVVRPHKYVAPFGTRQTAQDACTSDNGIPVQMFDTPIAEDDNGSITLTGEIDICPSLNFNWQIGGFPPSLQTLTATATLAEGSQITIEGAYSNSFDKNVTIATITTDPIPVVIAGVPTILTPTLTFFIGVSGEINGSFSAGLSQNASITGGLSYSNGEVSPVLTTSNNVAPDPVGIEASLSAKAYAGVTAELTVDGVLSPSFSPDTYLQLNADTSANPWWTLSAGWEGNASVELGIFGLEKTFSLPNIFQSTPITVAQASGGFLQADSAPALTTLSPKVVSAGGSGVTLTVNGSNFVPGTKVTFNNLGLQTTFVSPNQVTAIVPAGNLQVAGTYPVAASNPGTFGGNSNAISLTVNTTAQQGPTAHFTMSAQGQSATDGQVLNLSVPANGNVTVTFASTSTKGSAAIIGYAWQSNGAALPCNGATCTYNFGSPSNTITLTVTDGNSNTSTTTGQVNLSESYTSVPDFSTASAPVTQTITQGGSTSYALTVQSLNGFNSPVTFYALNPPSGYLVSSTNWSPISATPPPNRTATSTFTIATNGSTATGTFTITLRAVSGTVTHDTAVTLTVAPSSSVPTLTSVSINPNTVTSAGSATITVTLTGPAPSPAGALVNLSSNNPPAFSPPSTLVVQPGQTIASTTINAGAVANSTVVTVKASYGGSTQSGTVTVIPSESGLVLSSIVVTPSSISTGSFATISVTLSGLAPAGGTTVSVQSSNLAAFPAPTTITVSPGQSTNGVSVQAGSVGTPTPVIVTATYGGATVTTTVMVNPSATTQVLVTPTSWQPVFTLGGAPATIGLQITSSSSAALTGTISANVPWITLDGRATYGWNAPESVSVTANPAGLTAATYNATITVTSAAASNSPVLIPVTMTVLSPLQVTTTSLPTATWGQPFSSQLYATGGTGYTWVLQTGSSLPPNLSLSASGLINGTLELATSTNTYHFTVIVTDSRNRTAYANLSLVVQAPVVVTPSASSFQFAVGQPYVEPPNGNNTISFLATGGSAPYTWTASGLPPGLRIDGTSGFIVGTPTQPGSFPATITATDSTGRTGSDTLTLSVVTTPLLITTVNNQSPPTLPPGIVGTAYNQLLDATGGSNAGYQWTLQGTLPPGLKGQVNPNAGCNSGCSFQFSGTPTQAGTFTFTLQVTDSLGDKSPQQSITLIINSGTPPQITTTTLSLGTVGQAYSFPFTATGGAGGYQWSIVGSGPDPGLQLSSAGVLQGSSTVANDCPTGPGIWVGSQPPFGTFSPVYFQVEVTDSAGQSANKQFCLPSYHPTPVVSSFMPAAITVNGQSQPITVNGSNFLSGAYLTGNSIGIFPVTFVTSGVLTFSLTPSTSAAYSLPGGGLLGEGTWAFWVVQPYSYNSNQNQSFTIYDPVPAISSVQAVLSNSTQPCTSNSNCQLIINGSGFVFSTQYQAGPNNIGSCVAQRPSTPIPWNTVTTCGFSLPSAGTYSLTVTNFNQPGGGAATATAQFTLSQ